MKRTLLGFCLGMTLMTGSAFAASPTLIDGVEVALSAQLYQETTYVSLRTLMACMAPLATVSWVGGQAVVVGEDFTLTARGGENYLTYNDTIVPVEHGILLEEGVTLVPVRILVDLLGGTVDWNPDCGTVSITSQGAIEGEAWSWEDFYWLARIISAESRGEPVEGQIAVGNVVLNRVDSDDFPDTIYEVIFDLRWGGQFEPVENGTIYETPTQECVLSALRVLEGESVVGDSLYFLAPALTDNHWAIEHCVYVTSIGCHWFYR